MILTILCQYINYQGSKGEYDKGEAGQYEAWDRDRQFARYD